MSGMETLVRRHQKMSRQIIELMPTEWQDVARIRMRWTVATGEVAEPSEFSKALRWMERNGLVERKNKKANDIEGVLWRRKERA
jgi:hypothetical protein